MPGAKKILYIIDSLSRGGAETILVNTILELVERTNWQIFLITTIGSQNEFAAVLPSSVGYRHFDCRGKNFLKGIRAIKKFVCEQGFDIIHAHLYHSIIISRLVSPPEVKLIGTYHNLDFNQSLFIIPGGGCGWID